MCENRKCYTQSYYKMYGMKQLKVYPVMESASTRAIVSAVTRRIGVAVLPYLLVEVLIVIGEQLSKETIGRILKGKN